MRRLYKIIYIIFLITFIFQGNLFGSSSKEKCDALLASVQPILDSTPREIERFWRNYEQKRTPEYYTVFFRPTIIRLLKKLERWNRHEQSAYFIADGTVDAAQWYSKVGSSYHLFLKSQHPETGLDLRKESKLTRRSQKTVLSWIQTYENYRNDINLLIEQQIFSRAKLAFIDQQLTPTPKEFPFQLWRLEGTLHSYKIFLHEVADREDLKLIRDSVAESTEAFHQKFFFSSKGKIQIRQVEQAILHRKLEILLEYLNLYNKKLPHDSSLTTGLTPDRASVLKKVKSLLADPQLKPDSIDMQKLEETIASAEFKKFFGKLENSPLTKNFMVYYDKLNQFEKKEYGFISPTFILRNLKNTILLATLGTAISTASVWLINKSKTNFVRKKELSEIESDAKFSEEIALYITNCKPSTADLAEVYKKRKAFIQKKIDAKVDEQYALKEYDSLMHIADQVEIAASPFDNMFIAETMQYLKKFNPTEYQKSRTFLFLWSEHFGSSTFSIRPLKEISPTIFSKLLLLLEMRAKLTPYMHDSKSMEEMKSKIIDEYLSGPHDSHPILESRD